MFIILVVFYFVFSFLVLVLEDNMIKIWDWEFGELERIFKGYIKVVLDVDFGGLRGNIFFVSCSFDMSIKLWDLVD